LYPTNLTGSQNGIIKEFVDNNRKREYSLKSIMSAVLYLCRTGAKEFPGWQLVYYYFHKWFKEDIWGYRIKI